MKLLQILLLISIVTLLSCNAVQTTGTSSDIDIELIGVAAVADQPIANATVTLSDKTDSSQIAETITDSSGVYRFDSVKVGHYYLTGIFGTPSEDTLLGTLSEIYLDSSSDTTVNLDTLWMQIPGAIRGVVNLNGGSSGRVLVYVPGTSVNGYPDSNGEFTLYPVYPDSNYTVRIECDGFTSAEISNITVYSGDTLELSPQNLDANNAPQNVQLVYDTLNNAVTLHWDPLKRDDVVAYVVARKDNPTSVALPVDLDTNFLFDTTYTDVLDDTLFSQSNNLTLKYFVQGINEAGERTGRSKALTVNAEITRDSSDIPMVTSFSIEEGEVLTGLTSKTIQWKYRGVIEWVDLALSTDSGLTWTTITSGTIWNRGEFVWGQVNNIQSDNCILRVRDVLNKKLEWFSKPFSIERIGEELITDGDFSNGGALWEDVSFHEESAVNASVSFDDGLVKVSVESCDTNVWKVRIGQDLTMPLYKSYTYELRARIKASKDTIVSFDFSSWDNELKVGRYYGYYIFDVDTEWKQYVRRFTLSEYDKDGNIVDDPLAEDTYFCINFGYAQNVDYYVDDISLTVVAIGDYYE